MVTDADLNKAIDDPIEVPVDPPDPAIVNDPPVDPPDPVIPDEPEDNAVRSNLGRKVKLVEETLAQINAKLDSLTKREDPIEDDDSPYLTVKQYQKIRQQEEQAVTQYNSDYIRAEVDVGLELGVTEKEHEEVLNEVRQNFYVKHSTNGKADAEKNYMKAYAAVLKRKVATSGKVNPLKGNPPAGPLGGVDPTKGGEPPVKTVKLDAHAAEFLKRAGLNDEWAAKALDGELPTHLMGSKGRI